MKIYQVLVVYCDAGRIQHTSSDYFYQDKEKAEKQLKDLVEDHNNKELNRQDAFIKKERERSKENWWRLYKEYTIEGIQGYYVPAYTNFIYLREIDVA